MPSGGWGGALMDEEHWHLVYAIVRHAASSPELRVPVTCKIRIFAARPQDLDRRYRKIPRLENDWTIRAGKLPFTTHRPMIARQFDLRRCWRSWFHTVQRNAKGGIYLHFSVPDGWIRPKSNMISVGWFAMCFDCRRLDVLSSQCMSDSATVHSIMPLHDGRHLEELWPACLWFLMCFWLDPKLEPELYRLYHSIIFIVSEFHNFMYTYDIYVHIIILLISHPPVRWSWWPITTCTRR